MAQQLHPQSTEDPLGGGTVAHDIQVEIEGDSLPQQSATSAEQQSMLGLGQTEVVNGSQQVTLEAPLTDQPLVQAEGKQGWGPRPIMDRLEHLYEVTGKSVASRERDAPFVAHCSKRHVASNFAHTFDVVLCCTLFVRLLWVE